MQVDWDQIVVGESIRFERLNPGQGFIYPEGDVPYIKSSVTNDEGVRDSALNLRRGHLETVPPEEEVLLVKWLVLWYP